jgi:uncharacterized protein (DUF927 family)
MIAVNNVDETTSEMGTEWQQWQQWQHSGNKEDTVIDLKSDGYEVVATVDSVASKNDFIYNYFDKTLIAADEEELMGVPYRAYPNYFKPLYYEQHTLGGHLISLKETNYILGMYFGDLVKNFTDEDIEFSPFVIAARVASEKGANAGWIMKYKDQLNKQRLLYLSAVDIDSGKYVQILLDNAFHITPNLEARAVFKKLLSRWKLNVDYLVPFVEKLGYSKKNHGFFLADGLYLADTKKYIWFDECDERQLKKATPAGSYQEWKDNIASEVVKYPFPAFALIYAFSSYLMQIIELSTTFVHIYGRSSRGKTLLLQLATSVHANAADPNMGESSYIAKWNTTTAGLESIARLFDGSIGVFDELHMCDDKQFSNAIYTICSGSSKTRAAANGRAQKKFDWKFLALSSGEQSGFEKLTKTNIAEATTGKAIRFIDIAIPKQIFTDYDGNELGSEEANNLATKLKEECSLNFGHAGRDFVQNLLNLGSSQEELKALIEQDMKRMFDKLTADLTLKNEERRIMRTFAMIAAAGNFAVMFDILPMTEDQVFSAVSLVRDIWLKEMAHFHNQKAKSEDNAFVLKKWIDKNMSKFYALTDPTPKNNCKGYYKLLAHGVKNNVYLVTSESFQEVFSNHKINDVCAELASKNILTPVYDEDGNVKRYQQSHRVSSIAGPDGQPAPTRLYSIDMGVLNGYFNNDDHDDDDLDDDSDVKMPAVSPQQLMEMMQKMMAEMSK